jgi:bacillithiol biosynthesis cysteine-adding enzyme BshC
MTNFMDGLSIPYTRVPNSSQLLLDYLYRFEQVAAFYTGSPFNPASYQDLANKLKSSYQDRRALVAILKRQNQAFGSAESTFANIQRLSEPGTFAVVTGQQVGLLSGPAFTLYKALTAVHLAQALAEQGLPSVPVFWLATEDHDLEEVAQAATFDEEYALISLADPGERPAPRSPVGVVKLSPKISQALDRLEEALPPGEPRDVLLGDLRACYQPGATWAEAFGRLMARLFGRWGVVLLDPLDDAVRRLSAPAYQQALVQAANLRGRLLARSQELVRAGYHAQVHVAEDSTLVFVTREGNRLPLRQREGEFFLDDIEKISLEELTTDPGRSHLSLSSNVLLRPVVQDLLLPTLAYVAGPSELTYLAQAHALYSAFGRPMPVVFPRAGFTLLDRRIQRLLEKYKLSVEDVWQGEENVRHKVAAAGPAEGWTERFDQSEQELAPLLGRLRQDLETLDPTLLDTLKNVEEKMKYQMERLRGKVSRAALERFDFLARHQQLLLRFLLPAKNLQERQVSGVYFLGRAGYELLDRILGRIQTDSSAHQTLVY